MKQPDLFVNVGGIELKNPVMAASGTAGFGTELSSYMDMSHIGAFVAKSLALYPWEGNPYPRVTEAPGGMLNSVGLQGPGIEAWVEKYLPKLRAAKATVVVSIWGKSVEEFQAAAKLLEPVKADLTALELNVSCPNLEDGSKVFSHSGSSTAEVVAATDIGIPRWAKLAPDTPDLNKVIAHAHEAGCAAVTLVNSIPAIRIDAKKRRPYLSGITGGFSGPALKPVALKAVYESYASNPQIPIVGVGGVRSGQDVAEFLMAGASAVQVGTAMFQNPRAIPHIIKSFKKWCQKNQVQEARQLIGVAHR